MAVAVPPNQRLRTDGRSSLQGKPVHLRARPHHCTFDHRAARRARRPRVKRRALGAIENIGTRMVRPETPNPFLGIWRIVEMELWDEDYLNREVPAFIQFLPDRIGEFQFGAVAGEIDYRIVERDGARVVEFSWAGQDDSDASSGRGWAAFTGAQLEGRIFIHLGDSSQFTARRSNSTA